ncbi:MAG: HlyD family efflux transporter periplasmic adaptor subunit [Bacteroidetes bacterium]|nr:MAG: HlyD family efflux transporter periplasmic adaptor subunit [Bacteroidota bacterium]
MGTKKNITIAVVVFAAIIAIGVIVYFSGLLAPNTFKSGTFENVTVTRGEVISTMEAAGVIESENEVILLSPAASIVKSILKEPGSQVQQGEIILQLQTETVLDEIDRLKDQLEVKRNNLERNQLTAQSTKLDLDYNEEVKRLKVISLKAQLSDQEQLLEVGGISPARVEETKQEITLAEKDLAMLIEKNSLRLKQLKAEDRGLLLQIRMDEKALEEKLELLSKMNLRAPSAGMILNISASVGEKVPADKMLVRMSDLSSFKLIGSINEQFAGQIKTGSQVFVNVENTTLHGLIGNITPLVENNKIQFNVHLEESSHPNLIANQNVQLEILINKNENALRIKKLPGFENGKKQKVYVIEGDKAVKRDILLGIIGNEYCEVLSGLSEGDVVIAEEMGGFRNLNEIDINK